MASWDYGSNDFLYSVSVTLDTEESEGKRRGRPQDEERTEAILEATHTVLQAQGLSEMKVSDIADAAGCGLATIYRRWRTKEDLVAAALLARPVPVVPETGDPVADLRALVTAIAEEFATMGENLIEFLAAANREPKLREAIENGILGVARTRITDYVIAMLGEDFAHTRILIDGAAGAMVLRAGFLGEFHSPEDFIDEVLALVADLAPQSEP